MVKISIIVPIYNVERFLEECLVSILNQSFKEFEVILINDGSLDNSLSICKKYENIDSRIKVFDTPNRGVSAARNLGIQNAIGEYITFVDPDDWIDPMMYEKMYDQIRLSDSDICMCGYNIFKENKSQKNPVKLINEDKVLNKEEIRNYLIPNLIGPETLDSGAQTIMGSVWRLLIKRQIIKEVNLKFPENIPLMEDLIFCVELFFNAEKISFLKDCLYYYRINEQSALNKYRENLYSVQMDVYEYIRELVDENGVTKVIEDRLENRYCLFNISAINNVMKNTEKNSREKVKILEGYCLDKKFQNKIRTLNLEKYTTRKRLALYLMKKNKPLLLYLYYSLHRYLIKFI